MANHSRISEQLKNKLLVEASHACSICGRSGVQIQYIDGDPSNNNEENLIVLCLMHHDEAEKSKSGKGLSANLSSTALRDYKRRLQANQRPTDTGEQAGAINANLQNVDRSNIIISSGDVTYASSSSQSAETKPKTEQPPDMQTENRTTKPNVGIITALEIEYVAVESLLENPREYFIPGRGAGRRYLLGDITAVNNSKHTVVLALLVNMGNNSAAARATLLLEHFPSVNSIIMVGIAGGIPNPQKVSDHVRLGDIVVSDTKGVVQYDFVKEEIEEIIHRNPPRPPSAALLDGVRLLRVAELKGQQPWLKFINEALQHLPRWVRPYDSNDILTSSTQPEEVVPHLEDKDRESGQPRVFTGPIASANILLKNPLKRDSLRDRFGVKAVEMEGSGIADATWNHEVGYLVVRGICDYCDSRKNDEWQKYASIVAAAYTRALLEKMPSPNESLTVSNPPLPPNDDKYKLTEKFLPASDDEDEDEDEDEDIPTRRLQPPDFKQILDGEDARYLRLPDEQRAAWREQLVICQKRLNQLEKQKAMYGSLNVPPHVLIQIDETKAEIKKLKALLV